MELVSKKKGKIKFKREVRPPQYEELEYDVDLPYYYEWQKGLPDRDPEYGFIDERGRHMSITVLSDYGYRFSYDDNCDDDDSPRVFEHYPDWAITKEDFEAVRKKAVQWVMENFK